MIDRTRATVLLVDDNQLNLELASDVLEAAGYTVRQVGSAEDALQAVQAERPDLILMDIGLPGMDGHAAVRMLKADASTRSIPVIALTAYAMSGDEQLARDSGFDAYITKPIQTRTLAGTVARLLSEPRRPV
ncbi:MAG TPA: response regulator [Gemmatimonadales bacterium]|nr:response regulator [Gemmatimonadales bacterium]